MASSYRNLTAWQKGIALAKEIYHFTKSWPIEELDGLTHLTRRTAVLVPCKLAAAHAVGSETFFRSNLCKAEGLLAELETLIAVARELDFCTEDQKADVNALILTEQRLVNQLFVKAGRKSK